MAADVVFLLGAPRSGTTWVQKMLGASPLVATPQELDLFSGYLAPWERTWRSALPASDDEWRRRRGKGLASVLTAQEFEALMRDVAESVYARVLALKPSARVVLDKVPSNSVHGELILRLFPRARFIHLVRDGRDVTASLVRAGTSWGGFWAPRDVSVAARQWRDHVVAARSLAHLGDAYLELRYEDLRSARGPVLLEQMLDFCGAPASPAEAAEIYDASALERGAGDATDTMVWGGEALARLGAAPPEPAGFAGAGGIGAWRDDLTIAQRLLVEREAGPLLRELGYADRGWTGAGALRRTRAAASAAVGRQIGRARYHVAAWIRG